MESRFWVIIPAAGVGSRMQADKPKQYLKLGGTSVLQHSIEAFLSHSRFDAVYVGIAECDPFYSEFVGDALTQVKTFTGGAERSDTVLKGLHAIADQAAPDDWVWVHDAARPCLSQTDIDQLIVHIDSVDGLDRKQLDGAILAAPVVDTIKRTSDGKHIESSVDRSCLWRALTPQVFRYADLKAAIEKSQSEGLVVTDEASAIEASGGAPVLIQGDDSNIKITRPSDLSIAGNTLSDQGRVKEEMSALLPRIGTGYDVHAFCDGDEVILGGVKIPHNKAFIAHSDGDVLLHAIMDAMLGALALGDIGKHFPDTDAKWKGANSRELLRAVNALINSKSYKVANLDSVIIAQAPKMSPHISAMQANIAEDLGLTPDYVGVKATTTESLGFTGRKEGIACQASVMLVALEVG